MKSPKNIKPRPLTFKQEKACQEFTTNGGNKTAAYRKAYNTKGMKPESINRAAKQLFDNPKITSRLKELQKPIAIKYEITREFLTENLMLALNEAKEKDDLGFTMRDRNCIIKASRELSKLHGLDFDKPSVGIGITVPAESLIDKGNSTLDELLKSVYKRLTNTQK